MNWFKRLCQRRNRRSFPDDWFWDALLEIRNTYFDDEHRHYWSLPEDDQFGHVFESLQLVDEVLDLMREEGWVPREPHHHRLQ